MTEGLSQPGAQASLEFEVGDADTAAALGSGDVDVLATPRLIAWCEAATMAVLAPEIAQDPTRTSVGTRVELGHLAPTPVGGRVTVTAVLEEASGSRRVFAVSAADGDGRLLCTGKVSRAVLARSRFAEIAQEVQQ